MSDAKTSARRLIAIASAIIAVVFGSWCLLWYVGGSLSNTEDLYPFLGVALVHLVAAVAFLAAARTRWRWAMLLITLPCAFEFLDRAYLLWRFTHA